MWIYLIVAMVLLVILVFVVSYGYYHRSLVSTLAEWYLRLTEKRYMESELIKKIEERQNNPQTKCDKREKILNSLQVDQKEFNHPFQIPPLPGAFLVLPFRISYFFLHAPGLGFRLLELPHPEYLI